MLNPFLTNVSLLRALVKDRLIWLASYCEENWRIWFGEINVISNGLEKCMSFILKHLVFIDSLQLLNSSLDTIKEKTFAQNRKIWGINFMIGVHYIFARINLRERLNTS